MVEANVSARIRAQGQRIKALRLARDLEKPLLASRLGFGTTQAYDLYERGHTVIRLDRVDAWAEAFDMTPLDFVNAVLNDPDPWSLEAELRDAGVPEWAVQRALQAAHGEPLVVQQWIAEKLREMHASGELSADLFRANSPASLALLRQA